jgi:hypothetical protein
VGGGDAINRERRAVLGQGGGAIVTSGLGRGMNTVVHWVGAGTAMFADECAANMTWAR